MSGSIGIIANETARFSAFAIALMNLRHPPNTKLDWALSTDMVLSRNRLVSRALEGGSEWLLFIDDDHVFQPDLLLRLLSHEQPLVCSLYLGRQAPFHPIAYAERDEDGLYTALDLSQTSNEELIPILAAGCSGMLIWSEVFRAIPEPWFEYGEAGGRNASEDIIFCQKASEAGFDIYLDPQAQMGHLASLAIWPSWIDEEWAVGFSVADSLRFYSPIEKAAQAADAVRR